MIRVYSDLNCPFCFVLHERLIRLPNRDLFDWRLIEHAPNLMSESNTRDELEQLAMEAGLAQQRAPDVGLIKPDFCVNTRLAILSYLAVEAACPAGIAVAYLTRLYRAYWRDQRDISRYEVLADLLQDLRLSWIDPDDGAEQRQLSYQREWQSGDFDDRIPAFHARDKRIMLGLQNSYNIINFANGTTRRPAVTADTCQYSGHHRLALCGVAESVSRQLKKLPDFICECFQDIQGLLGAVDKGDIDAIVISSQRRAVEDLIHVREGMSKDNPLPVIFIGVQAQQTLEAVVFNLGACDFILENSDFGSLRARLNLRISSHKTIALLSMQAHIDSLTGLSNRRSFEQYLERAWRHGCRHRQTLSVVIIDCDGFKAYNDHYGHFAGDQCLQRLSRSLAAQVHRPSDVVARLGGEEFVILLPATGAEQALKIAERARQDIVDLRLTHATARDGIVTISCGVASTCPHADQTPLALMEEADQALYQAKAGGRNRCVARIFSPLEFFRQGSLA